MTEPVTTNTADSRSLLVGLRALLCYHRAIGLDTYPKNRGCQELLRWQAPNAAEDLTTSAPRTLPKPAKPGGRGEAVATPFSSLRLADIAAEVRSCQACELHRRRLYPVPGQGAEPVRLFVVGDRLMAGKEGGLPPDRLFGVEQDAMLARMLAAIQLPMAEVFITNVVKCGLPASAEPDEGQVACCRSYVLRQLAAASPQLILTMGSVATRAVLGKSTSFTRVRGKMQFYQGESQQRIPVLATYHPTYLLQNAEMKQVAWADLQLLARELGRGR